MVSAFKNGLIAGAGLDFFEFEPARNHELLEMNNVILSPHTGTVCPPSRINVAKESAINLISYLVDNHPVNVVNIQD